MHQSILEQGCWLKPLIQGIFAYHAIPTNSRILAAFRRQVIVRWRHTLRRRSQKDALTWARMLKIANEWLPPSRILHPWPSVRFAVRHPS